MKVLISGASGLVGAALSKRLRAAGDEVKTLSRGGRHGVAWDPATGEFDAQALNAWGGPEAVVHLAGESIAARRWNEEQKQRIRESRVPATQKLCQSLARLNSPPRIFLCASAVGIYGSRGDEVLTEDSAPGGDFLSSVAVDWEKSCTPMENAQARVVHLRFGMILAREGGALPKLLRLFRLGLGGKLSTGQQWVSWVALEDVLGAIEFALREPVQGALNVVAPNPVTNADFTRHFARAVHRPALIPAPRLGLRVALGEMADALLLASQRALPQRLLESGFKFKHPDLPGAFEAILR